VEKYRPKTVDATILPPRFKDSFKAMVQTGGIPNIILAGGPGIGKTTIARAMISELDASFMMVNGSLDANKDMLRTEIKDFASSMSLSGGRKYVIIDEADYLSHIVQPALRNFMEEFSANCGFILTCNFKHKIIEPLHSRCALVEFNFTKEDKASIIKEVFGRVLEVLDAEEVEYDKKVVVEVIKTFFPDLRKMLNELQNYSVNGKIDTGILVNFDDVSIKQLMKSLKDKKINEIRDWVAQCEIDEAELYRKLYDNAENLVATGSIPQLIMILGEYQYKSSFVANPDINMAACLIELAIEMEWK
jgi:DNA polymerase III delta prime subunit